MEKQRHMLLPDVYLTILHTDKFRTNCLSVNLLRPLRDQEAAMNALLPDVLLRGCRMCPDMSAVSAWLDQRYGAGIQTVVRKKGEIQSIGFFADYIDDRFTGPDEHLTRDMCHMVGSFLLEPVTQGGAFRPDYVDGERINLINAIMAQVNDKRTYAAQRLREEMFEGEAFGVSRLGRREQVEAITPEGLYAHYRYVLAHSRIELVFAGRADPDLVAEALREVLRDLPRAQVDAVGTRPGPMPGSVREITETMDVTQGNLVMGFRTDVTAESPDYPALLLLNSVYGGGVTSKLFTHVRERLSLCYYASSGLDRFKGMMLVSSGVDAENYDKARSEILRQLDACREGDIREEELTAARSVLCSSLRSSGDSLGWLEDFWLGQACGGYSYTPEDLSERLRRVTPEDLRRVAGGLYLDTVYFLKGAE